MKSILFFFLATLIWSCSDDKTEVRERIVEKEIRLDRATLAPKDFADNVARAVEIMANEGKDFSHQENKDLLWTKNISIMKSLLDQAIELEPNHEKVNLYSALIDLAHTGKGYVQHMDNHMTAEDLDALKVRVIEMQIPSITEFAF